MNLTDQDFDDLISLISLCGFQEIMPHFRRLEGDDISAKANASDLVTIADVAAEKFLTKELRAKFPDAIVFGEESVSEDANVLKNHKWEGVSFVAKSVLNFKDVLCVCEGISSSINVCVSSPPFCPIVYVDNPVPLP